MSSARGTALLLCGCENQPPANTTCSARALRAEVRWSFANFREPMKTERVLKPLQMFWVCSSVLLLVSAVDAQETRKLANDYREWQRFDSRARGQATKGKSKSRTAAQKGRQGDDWPQFRGPSGLGTSAATGIPTQWTPQNI